MKISGTLKKNATIQLKYSYKSAYENLSHYAMLREITTC